MSKRIRRPHREAIKEQRRQRKKAQGALRKQQEASGLIAAPSATISNRRCEQKTEAEERAARGDAVRQQIQAYRAVRRLAR